MVFLRCFQMIWMLVLQEQTLNTCCFLFANNAYANHVNSKVIKPQSTKRYVVVFDVDTTLSVSPPDEAVKFIKTDYPDCPVIQWKYEIDSWGETLILNGDTYVFLPYLRILFDYLLEKGVRIVFFSARYPEPGRDGDMIVIPRLLASFWGKNKLKALKSEGQFRIFTRKYTRHGNASREGDCVKDLKIVLRVGESLSDVILVESDYTYIAFDQRPCLLVTSLSGYDFMKKYDCAFNNIYYMLGVFKVYFENDKYKKLPLKVGLEQILPKDIDDRFPWFKKHPFARKMIDIGLREVQKQVPYATVYKVSERDTYPERFYPYRHETPKTYDEEGLIIRN